MSPVSDVAAHYRKRLARQLAASGIKSAWVARARVLVNFNVAEQRLLGYERFGRGRPFTCTVELSDDLGRTRAFEARGRVDPHDVRREQRSLRREEI